MRQIKVGIVDNHNLFLKGLTKLVNEFDNVKVVLQAESGKEALQKLKITAVDVVFMDIEMPEMDGFETTLKISTMFPNVKVIALTMYDNEKFIVKILTNGGRGFLMKTASADQLEDAIYSVHENGYFFNEKISKAMLSNLKTWQKNKGISAELTVREIEVLELICREFTTKEICEKLFVSRKTVEGHRAKLFEKTASRNVAGLVIYAVKHNIV